MRLAIGVIIAFSVWVIRRGVRLPPNPPRLLGGSVGLISGIISGLASMGAAVRVAVFDSGATCSSGEISESASRILCQTLH